MVCQGRLAIAGGNGAESVWAFGVESDCVEEEDGGCEGCDEVKDEVVCWEVVEL